MCLVRWPVKRKFCKKKKRETLFEEQNFFFHELFRWVQPKRVVSAWNLDLVAESGWGGYFPDLGLRAMTHPDR